MFDFAKFFANARARRPRQDRAGGAAGDQPVFAQGVIADAKELCPVMDAPHGQRNPAN